MIAKKLVKKNQFIIERLIQSGRKDWSIISLILCESYFKRKDERLLEFISMPILYFINRSRLNMLSVGIGQVQIRHWNKYSPTASPISIKSIRKYLSIESNYDVIEKLLSENNISKNNKSKLIASYRGETRKFHFDLFCELKKELNQT